jgi:hypothetical protein
VGAQYAAFLVAALGRDKGLELLDYVTLEDLSDYTELDSFLLAQGELALQSAMQTVRNYLGQELTLHVDDVEVHDGRGRRLLRLRERPVREVKQVVVDGVVLDDSSYTVDDAVIKLTNGAVFNHGLANIEVTYTHGWDLVDDSSGPPELPFPADIKLVTLSVARRRLNMSGQHDETIVQEAIGSYSYSTGSAREQAGDLLFAEKAVLDNYRIGLVV